MVWRLTCPEWALLLGVLCLAFWLAFYLYEILFEITEESDHPDDTWLDDDDDHPDKGDDSCPDCQQDTLNENSG